MYKSSFVEVIDFAHAITTWVEMNCICMDINNIDCFQDLHTCIYGIFFIFLFLCMIQNNNNIFKNILLFVFCFVENLIFEFIGLYCQIWSQAITNILKTFCLKILEFTSGKKSLFLKNETFLFSDECRQILDKIALDYSKD